MGYRNTVPKLTRLVRSVPLSYRDFSQAVKNPFDFFDEVRGEPLSADELYTGFALARILRHKCNNQPLDLQRIVKETNRYYPELGEHDVNFIRTQLKYHFSDDYSEGEVSLLVLETERKKARVEVSGEPNIVFRTGLPFRYFGNKPEEGNKYTCIVWDLFKNWFGIQDISFECSVIPEWTPEKRKRFQRSLSRIQPGPRIERDGRKDTLKNHHI